MERIVLWGSGVWAEMVIRYQAYIKEYCYIMGVFDNDSKRWGGKLGQYVIQSPERLAYTDYDKIIIATVVYFDEIKEQLTCQMNIPDKYIKNIQYLEKKHIIWKYQDADDEEIQEVIKYLKDHDLAVFNYPFVENYAHVRADIGFDDQAGIYYVWHNGFRMYMARHLDTEDKVLHYYRSILLEQDAVSPHRYLDHDFFVSDGDIVVDVGTAEGNFALEVLDKASRIYLIEAEEDWVEALQYTFADYRDKIVIIQGYASDCTEGNRIALDDVIKEEVQFIKMDIEGWEARALAGAHHLMEISAGLKCAVCAYHNNEDEGLIRAIAKKYGFKSDVTRGYMYYPVNYRCQLCELILRRGVVRLVK